MGDVHQAPGDVEKLRTRARVPYFRLAYSYFSQGGYVDYKYSLSVGLGACSK